MKLAILISFVLIVLVTSNPKFKTPSKEQSYRTKDVFDLIDKGESEQMNFFPYLDEYVTYHGWYRKPDSNKSEKENLKDQISLLTKKLYGDKTVDMKKLVNEKMIFDDKFITNQLKIARIFELEDLLNKEKDSTATKKF